MARIRTVDFLPEIFQTPANKQFLAATLDQLVQEPSFSKIQGYVGRQVGPGVNPNDEYIKEETAVRTDYQLEPGVIMRYPDSSKIRDAITYPGITDAIGMAGGFTNNAQRIYTSEYYTFDPFVDFDKFVNFSQYYWLPAGPDAVNVYSGKYPLTESFDVTRANGTYTFSSTKGDDPTITLVRGGSYQFNVAQNNKETVNYRVSNDTNTAFLIDYERNPTLKLIRGNTYVFTLSIRGNYSFYIKTAPDLGTTNQYTSGVTNNGTSTGTITFVVPQDAPDTLYYTNDLYRNMQGTIEIVDAVPGFGPGFWIQAEPGVNGTLASAPNISSRDVLGVINNGEDLGTVTFNVPLSTAQSFYYTLNDINSSLPTQGVDLISSLKFNEINNIFVADFLAQHPTGIDGVTNLNGRTLVFLEEQPDPEAGGWQVTTQYDPLASGTDNNGRIGSFDSTTFDQTTDIPADQRYSVWQANYVTAEGGSQYIKLTNIFSVANYDKFSILAGTTYSSTQWYKTSSGVFEQIPLLTAVKDTLYYQDGTDPEIFGRFNIVDESDAGTLDVNTIIGKKNYTSPNGVVFTNGLKVTFIGNITPTSYENNSYYVEGVGTAIKLLPIVNFVTPETYTQNATIPYDSTGYDIGNFDASLNQPEVPDYLVINRASPDLSAWCRTNRWFHIDVINASAQYNNTVPVLDNNFRAKRPILEYRAGTKLFDYGTEAKQAVDIIDFSVTDALSTVNGSTGYSTDGYTLISGSRVIFAADVDPEVRNNIYVVEFIVPDTVAPLINEPIINLVPATDSEVLPNQCVVCLSGDVQQGLSFYYDGIIWISAQQKYKVNQAPLFDVYDVDGVSYGDRAKYPSTNFIGSKLFSYAVGAGTADTVLGFPLKYLSLSNVGDIVFDNNLYQDTFTYTKTNASTTVNISDGNVRQYQNRISYSKEIGWQTAITKSAIRQQFRFQYDGTPLLLDVPVDTTSVLPAVQLFVGGIFVDPSNYTVAISGDTTTITTVKTFAAIGDIVEVDVLSNKTSKVGFYQVPINLENNPLNENSPTFTLGTVRSHYQTIAENLKALVGPINGANNTRDLGNIIPYGTNILQQSSPMTLAGYFMRSVDYNVFNSIEWNSRQYENFKAQLLATATRNDYTNYTIPDMLTAIISDINTGKTQYSPFYWSDMLPASPVYSQSTTTITAISTNVFDLTTTYDFTSSNYAGLLVYLNDTILTVNKDYTVSTTGPRLTITTPLNVGDVVVIREYNTTYGNYVPNTPTKMGLYPAWRPQKFIDPNYLDPQLVIQGHDGSITMAFGDFRDDLLIEFETRIFNNLKIKSPIPIPETEVIPGQFRSTDYTLSEVNQILSQDFLSWIGRNKLNFNAQTYLQANQFTWNYSSSGNKITGPDESALGIGAWRGLYQYFYDTTSPNTTPWEMLGFSVEPNWWQDVYGAAPYTGDNLVLWDDLTLGKVADPAGVYYLPQYARPQLPQIIPTGSEGELLSPFNTVVGSYDNSQFQKSWVFGDGGPVEYSWKASSSYPFAIMRLLALTRPAEFFSLFADRDLYKFDTDYNQYLYESRYRLNGSEIQVYGNGVSKASYINWIVDYNQQTGINSTTALETDLANIDVRLCYRMSGFTDKQYTRISTEKSSPNSLNSSLLLPDDSYNLLVYKNQPFDRVTYSSVVVQVVEGGFTVYGYSITSPYFDILVSKSYGTKTTISAGGEVITVPNQYTDQVVSVPYGYVFTNKTMVIDFLLSYGALLSAQGLVFDDLENGYVLNWNQMAQEYLYWANQGWEVGSVINLNPTAFSVTAIKSQAIVDSIVAQTPENNILDQNRSTVPVRDLVIERMGNSFKAISQTQQSINYLDLKYTSYESLIILDNLSIFADLIYDPVTGARQGRVLVESNISNQWDGQLNAQGFILNNQQTVEEWKSNKKYSKGEIVLYKNNYWSAQTIVQPKAKFDYSDWVKSDYTKIQGGMLQNLPNFSNQLSNSYDVYNANLATDQDLVSYGLIGFRPRQYMASLNLDDVSQVNLYKEFIRDKGSIRSVRLIGNAQTTKETAEYDLFENWAILRGTYGANANRSFIEIRLNEADLLADPSVVQVVNVGESSQADQTVLLQDLWRQSYKIPNTNIFTTTTEPIQDYSLPSAGYVDLNDVDVTVFSLDGQLKIAPTVLSTIGVGTTIWTAKINKYDWNVYRCTDVPGYVSVVDSNLNSTASVQYTQPHGLLKDDVVIIRFFNSTVDGIYKVLAVPSANSIIIALPVNKTMTGHGISLVLRTMRVSQASDVLNLSYANLLTAGTRAWVDDNGAGLWTVLEKQTPFIESTDLPLGVEVSNSQFGASVAQGYKNIIAAIGSPGYYTSDNSPTQVGAVYPYLRDNNNQYAQSTILTLGTTGTLGYGNSVDIGSQSWLAAGASASNNKQGYAAVIYRADNSNAFEQRQLLVAPDSDFSNGEFGYAVSVSDDERWMYIGAPGKNKVYAYARQDVEFQQVKYTTDGTTRIFSFANQIEIDPAWPTQLAVVYNNTLLSYPTDYSVTGTSVVLTNIPPKGQSVIITRKSAQQLDDTTFFELAPNASSASGTGAKFTITNTRGQYYASIANAGANYTVGDTFTYYGLSIENPYSEPTPGATPANNLVVTVASVSSTGNILTITTTGSGIGTNNVFQINPYLYGISNIWQMSVTVDGVLQRPLMDYTFNYGTQKITFSTVPAVGASIVVTANTQFNYVDTLTVAGLNSDARFGESIVQSNNGRSIVIGASADDSSTVNNSGTCYAFDRGAIQYIVSDTSITTFALPSGFLEPVSVIINGNYLINSAQYLNGQFSVVGSNVVLDSSVQLNVGDVIQIENNIFTMIQKMEANAPFDQAAYGEAIDICPFNCSLAIGSPADGSVLVQAGSVERRINQSRVYGITTSLNANPSLTPGDTIRINNQVVAVPSSPNNTVTGLSQAINSAQLPNITSVVANGLLTISIINQDAATLFDKLQVLPGESGTAFDDLGFDTYAYTQTIVSPNPVINANFGSSVAFSSDAATLIVGAPLGNLYEPNTFDNGTTYFDDRSTVISSTVIQSGVVYSYDYLSSSNSSIYNPGQYVFGQQIFDHSVAELDQWGAAVSYVNGRLLIGSPGSDLGDSSVNYGRVAIFANTTNRPAWYPIHVQTPVADVNLIGSVYMYNKLQSSETYFFDAINPLQGKILGAARQNIDYISSENPAKYNSGPVNNNGNFWGEEFVGRIWWDISSVRFIDPMQNDIVYTSRRWAQVFPGSRIEVYQWIQSPVPPAEYTGSGTPLATDEFTVITKLNTQGVFVTSYFFWVTGLETIDTSAGKTLSTGGIARYIENPKSSGIPYIAPIDANTFAIYNGIEFLSAADTIIHIDYDREATGANIHTEYELIAQDKEDSFINASLYRKLQDSFCGVNTTGAPVPDITLSPAERYGVQFRPRQSMFVDRYTALENYLTYANNRLKNYPTVENKSFTLLDSSEPIPTVSSGEWDKKLANIEELSYQNLYAVPLGYKYLVEYNSNYNGAWTIYTVTQDTDLLSAPRFTMLVRVQNYDTKQYWSYINWYDAAYNSDTVPVAEVANYSDLASIQLTTKVGDSVKVTSNAQGKFEIYQRTTLGWDRVGLQDGTIAFKEELWDYSIGRFGFDSEVFDAQYFDEEPVIETRKIIQAINEELFVGDLALERNKALILMFNYILSETESPEWLMKTSLIDVNHKIRQLLPYQIYRLDNQEFVLDYINEVKPYHVQIRDFSLTYNGEDDYLGQLSDFDVPSYYDRLLEIPQYVSPVLLPYDKSTATGTGTPNSNSDATSGAQIWAEWPWSQWYNNYLLSVSDVTVINGGFGYLDRPVVTITGDCTTPAELLASINSAGQVVAITVINPGEGYVTTPTITITGGSGAGATAYPIMDNGLVRSIKTTIKYDRYDYQSNIVDWQSNVSYSAGTQVRYNDRVWAANSTVQTTEFDPDNWTLVPAADLSGINRTQGFYVPTVNEPGLQLPLLIDGLVYPGVQVMGPNFNQNTGFDVGNFDINPYDNLSYGPEGRPTYDPAILDAIYESAYLDPFLGTRATDINVDGGAYIDTYSSYAPEELVPGSEFDTLDFRVYARPGADWSNSGHGFPLFALSETITELPATYDFSSWFSHIPYAVTGYIYNQTIGLELTQDVNLTVDWINKTFTIFSGVSIGDVVTGTAYGLGGGNQLYQANYNGNDIGDTVTIPVQYSQIQEIVVWVNGDQYKGAIDYVAGANNTTVVTFGDTFVTGEYVVLYAIGPTTINGNTVNYSWSAPVSQIIVADGTTTLFELENSLEYTNPANLIVTANGNRLRTAAGVEYYADGSSAYLLPDRLGFSQALIADNEVLVYINDIPQVLGVDFTVEPYASEGRRVDFTTTPSLGERILIAVTTNTQARVNGTNSLFIDTTQGYYPVDGDIIEVTTWNDTRQQDILTKVYVGPVQTGITVTEGFDDTAFDPDWQESVSTVTYSASAINKGVAYTIASIGSTDFTLFGASSNTIGVTFSANWVGTRPASGNGTVTATVYTRNPDTSADNFNAGSFDYAAGIIITANNLFLDRVNENPSRLWVNLNGRRLSYGAEFTVENNEIILASGPLNSADVVMITEFTSNVVPAAMAFRIFQDMRDVQATYRITPNATTALAQSLSTTDDVIYVVNAAALDAPDISANFWGVLTIDGERIMYRERDVETNTVSSLLRGTAGTAIAEHTTGSAVYATARGEIMPTQFQNYIVSNTFMGDASTTTFVATNIEFDVTQSSIVSTAVEVWVGGTRVTNGYTVSGYAPVSVEFNTAPPSGVDVVILVRRGVNWYAPGAGTPSNGVALQDTNTQAARFLRGV